MRRRMARRRSGKREMIWAAQEFADQGVGNAATTTGDIVADTDWAAVGGFAKGATLERIRGNLSFNMNSLATAQSVVYVAILCLNDGETDPDPSNAVTYVEEDVLWQRVLHFSSLQLTAAGAERNHPLVIDVDVKARRKLDANKRISITWRASAASTNNFARISGLLRALISLP